MTQLNSISEQLEPRPPMELIQAANIAGYPTRHTQVYRGTQWLSVPLLLFIGLAIFIGWAAFFEIDQSVRASGEVIPSARTQIIQVADGGVLAKLLVQEGDVVIAGQRLAILEKERVNAAFEESRSRVAALNAALVRSRAEALGYRPVFGEGFNDYPRFVRVQRSLYEQREQSLHDELNTHQTHLDMAQEELRMNESLLKTGDASRFEVMRARRQVSEIEGKVSSARNKYQQEARQEAAKLEAELDVARYKLEERKNVLKHTEITAPTTGVVKYLKLNTQGGVLRGGDELMQISPTESEMVIEIKVNPVDIGQLKLGLPVSIKLDAFDYSIYGSLQGELIYISSDTLTEQTDKRSITYYRAQITVDEALKNDNPKLANLSLKPGMTATVDIQTSKRTILHYLTKPVTRAFGGALNER